MYFYPRPPRGGRPVEPADLRRCLRISIHALREEGDPPGLLDAVHVLDFYPRPPRGGRLLKNGCAFVSMNISIHALREEGDRSSTTKAPTGTISIHALREEGDMAVLAECCCSTYFYPRPPRGGRRERIIFAPAIDRFLSTPSARRATPKNKKSPDAPNDFYTRPPRGGRPKARP